MCLGIPGQVLDVAGQPEHCAMANVMATNRTINISLVEDEGIAVGDWVLVHAGFALSKITDQEARETLALLQEMSDAFMSGDSSPTSQEQLPYEVD